MFFFPPHLLGRADLPTQLRDHMVSEGVTLAAADHTVVLDYNMLSTDAVLKVGLQWLLNCDSPE